MPSKYTIELDAREAVLVRVALRKTLEQHRTAEGPVPAWRDVRACADNVLAKLADPRARTEAEHPHHHP